ncbi:adenosine deaminase/editase [Hysterangium stoloniferum]|nr:adenosine deaminase/editase [Hysterangium stoloniferum]
MSLADSIVRASLHLYVSLKFRPANPSHYSILSTFTLVRDDVPECLIKPVSLATGAKCLPESRLTTTGDMVHDSHAEVLARRGFVRWLLEEACRVNSPWIEARSDGKWGLKRGVSLHLYISTLPCGDASMRTLAAAPQDPTMAALKASGELPVPVGNAAARGRDNYSLLGVLRTKPGRADSPPTSSMSCSDKIARWSLLGVQGALASNLFDPVYISEVIIGGVPLEDEVNVNEDCERAFWRRLDSDQFKNLPPPYALHSARLSFTRLVFPHGRQPGSGSSPVSCNESLCWISDSSHHHEVLIHGLRRGVGAKQRSKPHLRPLVSKIALFSQYQKTLSHLELPPLPPNTTYYDAKLSASSYQFVKDRLINPHGPFAGWLASGGKWDIFTL